MSWWCKGSTLSRHVRSLGIDSRVRTLFSIDLCCIYIVFTMLFIFVNPMYRGLGIDFRVRTLFSIDLCCIYLVFTMLFIFVKRMYS